MAPPRQIQGSIGSRVRVILGDTGNEWLLILNHDDGNRKWQSHHWQSIPEGLAKQINNCTAKDRNVEDVDFGPNDSWYVYGEKAGGFGGHWWTGGLNAAQTESFREMAPCKVALGSQNMFNSVCLVEADSYYNSFNIPTELHDRVKEASTEGRTIHMIRLFSDGNYFIADDDGSQWELPSIHLEKELRKNQKEEHLAVAGDGSWIVVRGNGYVPSTGVDSELQEELDDFFRLQRQRKTNRQREIKEYHDRQRAEQEAKEAAEREQMEAAQRAAREEEERRRAEEERKRREEEERAKKAAENSRATSLEVKLVEKLTQEKASIDKLETNLEAMQDHLSAMQDDLYSRKRSLRESLVALPPAQRPRWNLGEDKPSKQQEKPQCVICQDKAPVRAVVPCGHVCLCDDCSSSISQRPLNDRLCPLCRGPASSTLRIYL